MLSQGNAEDEEQEEEEEDYSSGAENGAVGIVDGATNEVPVVTTSTHRPLNPECQEFRPSFDSRIASTSSNLNSNETTTIPTNSVSSSSKDSSNNPDHEVTSESIPEPSHSNAANRQELTSSRISETASITADAEKKNSLSRSEEEVEAAPVDFASEVFANVTNMAERALAPRSVVEGTPIETEIGLEASFVNFQEIVDNRNTERNDAHPQMEDTRRNRRRIGDADDEVVPNGQGIVANDESSREKSSTTDGASEASVDVSDSINKRQRGTVMNEQRGSRSASPGMINRTTTPINSMSQRLPESYESLVTRGSNASSSASSSVMTAPQTQQQAARNRKYTAKGPKFVREATPGPDLDVIQQQQQQTVATAFIDETNRKRNNKAENGNGSEPIIITPEAVNRIPINNEIIATGVEALEAEIQSYSLSTTGSFAEHHERNNRRDTNADGSNDDSGVESQTRFSDHPITDAVNEWLQRANSPELFVTSTVVSGSEPEDDELEEEEPPKNLQGNPMPALSANSSVNDTASSRLASCGEFTKVTNGTVNSKQLTRIENNKRDTGNTDIDRSKKFGDKSVVQSRRSRRMEAKRRGSKNKVDSRAFSKQRNDARTADPPKKEAAGLGVASNSGHVENKKVVNDGNDDVCEFAENDSVAGMRVAKSSRTKKKFDSDGSRVDKSRRYTTQDESTVIMLSSRDVPVENVEVKVRRLTDDNDEGIVEDEEVNVRTFEKGQIVVSIDGKVLPAAAYEPILLQHQATNNKAKTWNEISSKPICSTITGESGRCDDRNDDETSTISETASKRNSLGSIDEPDVLECWEVETVEPIKTPKKLSARGTSQEGEAVEDDVGAPEIDSAGIELVRKYYRLEAMRDSGTSVTSIEEDFNNDDSVATKSVMKNSLSNSSDRTMENFYNDEIPVIGERMSKIVENMMNKSGIPVEQGVEVYESCYTGKSPPYILGLEAKFRRTSVMYGKDPEREGTVPCKAPACCNIQ